MSVDKTSAPRVSVIVPVFNAERWLPGTLESMHQQTYQDVEYVLVDDSSTDDSLVILRKAADSDNRFRIIQNVPNGGLSAARNLGLGHARGELITFWDADDAQEETMLEKMVAAIDDGASVACCGLMRVDTEGACRRLFCGDPLTTDAEGALRMWLKGDRISTGAYTKLVRRELLAERPFCEGEINEDVMYTAEILAGANSVVILGEPLYRYFARDGSVTSGVGPQTMVVFENCARLTSFVVERFPALASACEDYCARATWGTCLAFARGDVRANNPELYKRTQEILREWSRPIRRQLLGPKERLLYILARTGLYGYLRR